MEYNILQNNTAERTLGIDRVMHVYMGIIEKERCITSKVLRAERERKREKERGRERGRERERERERGKDLARYD